MGDQFRRADRLGRRQGRVPYRQFGARLFQRARLQHGAKAAGDAGVQPGHIRHKLDRLGLTQRQQRRAGLPLPGRQPLPGDPQDLPGALNPHRIGAVDPAGRFRVQVCQQRAGALRQTPLVRLCADFGRGGRDLCQASGQGLKIEARAADNHHRPGQQRRQIAQPVADRIGPAPRHMPIQGMRQRRFLGRRGPGGQHAPVGINL